MPDIAKLIEVEREGDSVTLRVDGEEFPWHLAPGVDLHIERGASPRVTLALIADEVQVSDRLRPPPPPEIDWLLRHAETGAEIGRYATRQDHIERDVINAADPSNALGSDRDLWIIKRIDRANSVFDVVPYKLGQ